MGESSASSAPPTLCSSRSDSREQGPRSLAGNGQKAYRGLTELVSSTGGREMTKHRLMNRKGTPHRHRFPRPALVVAAVLAVAALLWMLVAVPALVKYPTDLDVDLRYTGTFTVLVNPTTAAPLAEPMVVPLTVDRHLEAVGDESGASLVVIRETIRQQAGDLFDVTQTNQYVMDRSTVKNVADDRAFAFEPANVVDRSGAYRLNLPFDTSTDETYVIYSNEIAGTYEAAADPETTTGEVEGLDISYFVASVDEAPMSAAYLAELSKAVPLPTSLTLQEMKPQLLAAGIDVDAVLAALTPVLTPEDTATLAEFAGEPIGLDYVESFGGRMAVEPVTGADVQVVVAASVGARPQVTNLPALLEVLGHYPDVPEAVAAGTALNELVAGPAVPLFEYSYEQTPASVADVANDVSAMRQQVLLAKVWLPLAVAVAALISLAIG
ncbi:MAG: DUF3068 domain-containing protein, partial [Actinobacteria bacterium]